MDHVSELIASDIDAYLRQHEAKSLLRFITCGSVDDGKSTLIGRMLHESKVLSDDQVATLEGESRKFGTQGDDIDFALLVDGLAAEREQGITIDVAYRFFTTDKRKFIVADTPGHEQYTRNMITGASTADVAVILIDARKGPLTQTYRHSYLVSLVGIRKVVLAINKMDIAGWSQEKFEEIERQYREFAPRIGLEDITAIPLSALRGDNVIVAGDNMPWYRGPTLIEYLEMVELDETRRERGLLRLPVQWVNRPHLDFRGFSGTIASGVVRPGDRVRAQPSGRESIVRSIVTADGELPIAVAGQSVTLTLADEIDVSRGDMLSSAEAPAEVADQFEATIVWMSDEPLLPERSYIFKLGPATTNAAVTEIKFKVNVNTLEHLAAKTFDLNEIGVCNIALDRAVPFDPYKTNPETGGFILIDRMTNQTVGAGMLHFALRRSHNIHRQHLEINKAARAGQKGQRPVVLWFTGLSGAGKSTIANEVEKKLFEMGRHSYLLDGDNMRHGLNRDLGFTEAERVENIRRVGEVARLMTDAGLIVLTAFISPFVSERAMARRLLAEGEFIEIHVDTPLEIAEQRDVKGLYRKARAGELENFTGIDSPYEPPENPELTLGTVDCSAAESADRVIDYLRRKGLIA